MLRNFLKGFLNSHSSFYKFLSYLYNYAEKGYLPRRVQSINRILESFSHSKSSVTFLQVGSNDGVTGDPLFEFVTQYNWKGVLIEPLSFLFERLKQNYSAHSDRVKFLQVAVGHDAVSKHKIIYSIDESYKGQVPEWYYQLASFDKDVIISHHGIPEVEKYITETEVPLLSLQTIVEMYQLQNLDLLHIDTEGYDFEVLKTLDFEKSSPEIILMEYIHLDTADRKSLIKKLVKKKYKAYRCNNDFLFVKNVLYKDYMKTAHIFKVWE